MSYGRCGVGFLGGAVLAMAGCGTPNVAPELPAEPKPADVFDTRKARAVRLPSEPDLMGWDVGSRANLNRLRQEGVVAVRYAAQGDSVEFEVLSNCIGPGKYAYQPYAESQSKTLKTNRDLFAELPISAVDLAGRLTGNRVLRTDYMLVGTASLPAGSTVKRGDLRGPAGECTRATHFVTTFYLGGFAMVAGEESKLVAKATVFGVAAGDEEGKSIDRIDQAGDPDACKEANKSKTENDGCRVPLRIGLAPLEDVAPQVAPSPAVQPAALPAVVESVPIPKPQAAVVGSGCPEGMVMVPGGTLKMGDRGDAVMVDAFCMDRTEVTVDAYAACVTKGACSAEHLGYFSEDGASFTPVDSCNYGKAGRGSHPINCVDWEQAAALCRANGRRLPAEEEWEWAARGGVTATTYPWGNAEPGGQLCWSGISKRNGTCAVGSFPSGDSPLGIHDLAGNVSEWTLSKYEANTRVIRGTDWKDDMPSTVRSVLRSGFKPSTRASFLGFRCARHL